MVSRLTGPGVNITLAGNGSLLDLSGGQGVPVDVPIPLVELVLYKTKCLGLNRVKGKKKKKNKQTCHKVGVVYLSNVTQLITS